MFRRPSTSRNQKALKTKRSSKDISSRVGPEYQVDIPKYIGPVQPCSVSVSDMRELKLWSPKQQPHNNIYEEYIEFAKQYGYPTDTAMTFLHWHRYNIETAKDDISNYVPIKPNWTKGEVLRFLKCIDSKPRKNFVDAKRGVPGRLTGEISELYYSIAAPFKASARKKHHGALISKCFSRAVRNGLIVSRWTGPTEGYSNNRSRRPGENKDALESEVELHLVSLLGMKKTGRLLGRRMLSVPYPFLPTDTFTDAPTNSNIKNGQTSHMPRSSTVLQNGDLATNGSSVVPIMTSTTYQPSSSGASSQVDGEYSCQQKSQPNCLPLGTHYDHSEFVAFASESEAELIAQSQTELKLNCNLDSEMWNLIINTENRACSVLEGIEMLKPVGGFPELSYRWSKSELALVLHAMSIYGGDFAHIARIIGSKSESFIQNFYNQFRDRFRLDEIIRCAEKPVEPVMDPAAKPEPFAATLPDPDVTVSPVPSRESVVKGAEAEETAVTVSCSDQTLSYANTTTSSPTTTTSSLNLVSRPQNSDSCQDGNGGAGKTPVVVKCTSKAEIDKVSRRPALKPVQEKSLPTSQPRRGRRSSSRLTESTVNQSTDSDRTDVVAAEKQKRGIASRRGARSFRRGCRRAGNHRGSRAPSHDAPRLQIGVVPGPGRRGRGRRRGM